MKKNTSFILKVTIIHVITYIICGIIFSKLFDYSTLFSSGTTKYFMKPVEGTSTLIGPLVQVIRGVLFGFVLLLIKDVFLEKKLGWLKLWLVILVIGIINTPGPAPCSIEGIVYTKLPLELHLKGAPEVIIQTLLFSYLVAKPKKRNKSHDVFMKNKKAIIASALAGIMFSISGIVLSFILNVDVMAGTKDIGAFGVMFIAISIVFLTTKWFYKTRSKIKWIMVTIAYYIAMAILPTVYNHITNSPFKSFLTLGINIIPVLILVAYNIYMTRSNNLKKDWKNNSEK